MEPITVNVIGNELPQHTEALTPDHKPNLIVNMVSPALAITIRFVNAYVTTLLGLVTVGVTTDAFPAPDFLHLVIKCLGLSLAGPAVALLKDVVTILGRLERKYPLGTGAV